MAGPLCGPGTSESVGQAAFVRGSSVMLVTFTLRWQSVQQVNFFTVAPAPAAAPVYGQLDSDCLEARRVLQDHAY